MASSAVTRLTEEQYLEIERAAEDRGHGWHTCADGGVGVGNRAGGLVRDSRLGFFDRSPRPNVRERSGTTVERPSEWRRNAVASAGPFRDKAGSLQRAHQFLSRGAGGCSCGDGDALDANEFERSCWLALGFDVKFNRFTDLQHPLVE